MSIPYPTPIYRFIHIDNLHIYLSRGGIHAPNFSPDNGLFYKTIHNIDIQSKRRVTSIPCGPGGNIHDYTSFYFGYLSPMMLQLKSGQAPEYNEGQEPLIYLASDIQTIQKNKTPFVFSDGHGIANYTEWYDDLSDLDKIDWKVVNERYWRDTNNDLDRQRRKQAEFLVYKFCDWSFIHKIAVIDNTMKQKVDLIFDKFPNTMQRVIEVHRDWYY